MDLGSGTLSEIHRHRNTSLLVHYAAVSFTLVGVEKLVHTDVDGVKDAVQLLQSLFRQSGVPAQDPGEIHMEDTKVSAAVDQGVVIIVGGQNPVRGRGGIWTQEGKEQDVFYIWTICLQTQLQCNLEYWKVNCE